MRAANILLCVSLHSSQRCIQKTCPTSEWQGANCPLSLVKGPGKNLEPVVPLPTFLSFLVSACQLLCCPDVAGVVDEGATKILADWFNCDELDTAHVFLQITETFAKHKNTVRMEQG